MCGIPISDKLLTSLGLLADILELEHHGSELAVLFVHELDATLTLRPRLPRTVPVLPVVTAKQPNKHNTYTIVQQGRTHAKVKYHILCAYSKGDNLIR